jgi:translocation and assembly module TamB
VTPRKRSVAIALAVLCGLALSLAAAVAWLFTTQQGLDRVIAALEALDVAGIRVEGAAGRLAGPLRIDRFRLGTNRVVVDATGIHLDHAPFALLFGRVSVRSLQADSLRVAILPGEGQADGESAPGFMPQWLAVDVAEARVSEASLELPGREPIVLGDLVVAGSITHRRIDLERLEVATGPARVDGRLQLVARRPLRLEGELDWHLATSPALAGSVRAKGDLDRLDLAARLVEPAQASATATLESIGPELRFGLRAVSEALDLSPWAAGIPFGPLAGSLEASGTLRRAEIRSQLSADGLPPGGLALEGSLELGDGAIDIERFHAVSAAGDLSATVRGRLEVGDEPALQLAAEWTGLRWPLVGDALVASPSGSLEASGWQRLQFVLDGLFAPAGAPTFASTVQGVADADGVTVTRALVTGDSLAAQGRGFFGFGAERPWSLEAQVGGLDLAAVADGLDSRLAFNVSGSGRGVGEQAAWAAYLGPLTGHFREWPVTGTGFVRHQPGLTDFDRFDFEIAGARVNASGRVGHRTRFDAELVADDLSALLPQLGGSLQAQVGLRSSGATATDGLPLRADLSLKGRDIAWGEQRAAVLSLDADVDLADRETSWARLRAAGVSVAGQALQSARLALDGRVADHGVELHIGSGDGAVDLIGDGAYASGTYRLVATRIRSSAPVLEPWSLEDALRLTASTRRARLEETCFVREPRRVCVEGWWEEAEGWSAALAALAFPLESLHVELPGRPGYGGVFDLSAEARGRPDEPWTAHVLATLKDGWLSYITPSGRRETLALGALELHGQSLPERHEVKLASRDGEALEVDGELVIERRVEQPLTESSVSGRLEASTRQLGLLPLLVPDIDRAGGRLTARIGIAGTVGEPALSGRALLEDGSLELYQSNLRLTGVKSRVELFEQGLELEASGRAGEGEFHVDGRLGWQDRVLRGTLSLDGERLLVADIPELRVEASPDLDFRIDGRDIDVAGTVTVPAARIEPRELVGAVSASADERIVGDEAEGDATSRYRVSTDLRLVLGDKVNLDAFGLRGRLEGSLRLLTRSDEVTTASGELSVEDGTYRAYNRRLDVDRGRLIFAGGPVGDPGIDLRASREVPGYDVGVIVRGRLRHPELSLFSDPSLPQSQIASLLLVGRTLDSLQAGDRQQIGGSTSDVATQGGALLAGQLGRYIGLDEVSLQTDTSYDASLIIGKFLSPRLYVSYGISLTDAINTFKARYTIGDDWVVSAEAGEETAVDVEYTIDR